MSAENTPLVTFKMAKKNRSFKDELIFHAAQSVQYAKYKFANYLESFNVVRSMSRVSKHITNTKIDNNQLVKANCWDNVIERSFFKYLKMKMFYENLRLNTKQMESKIFDPNEMTLPMQYIEM